jgi:hypothetical protein
VHCFCWLWKLVFSCCTSGICLAMYACNKYCDTCSSGRRYKLYEEICVRAVACFCIRTPVFTGWNHERATITEASIGASLVTFRRPAELWRCSTYSATCLSSPTLLRYVGIVSVFLRNRLHGINWWISDEVDKIAREWEYYLILLVWYCIVITWRIRMCSARRTQEKS